MFWVLEIILGVASEIIYAIMERLIQQFSAIREMIINPQDRALSDALKDLPAQYEVAAFSSDVEVVNRALSIRPIVPDNFTGLKTPLQQLLAACALMAMAQLDANVRQELERIDQRLCELSDQLAPQLTKIEDSLREIYEETASWFGNVDQELDAIQKEIRGIRDDINRLRKGASLELRQELETVDTSLRKLSQDVEKRLRGTDAQIADLNRAVTEIGKSVEVVGRDIRALRKQEIKRVRGGLGLGMTALATLIGLVIGYSLSRRSDRPEDYPLASLRELPSTFPSRRLPAPGTKDLLAEDDICTER